MSGITAVGYFLFNLVFNTFIFFLWIRIALRYYRISALHPLSQTIERITNPIVKPFYFFYQSANTRSHRFDLACLTTLVLIELLKFTLLSYFSTGLFIGFPLLLVQVLVELIIEPCNLLFYAILIRVVLSWVNPMLNNPITGLIYIITEPLLHAVRSRIPVFSGIDFSPFIVMVFLKMITLFITVSLPQIVV